MHFLGSRCPPCSWVGVSILVLRLVGIRIYNSSGFFQIICNNFPKFWPMCPSTVSGTREVHGLAETKCSAALLLEVNFPQVLSSFIAALHVTKECSWWEWPSGAQMWFQHKLFRVQFCFVFLVSRLRHAYVASMIGILVRIWRDMVLAISQVGTREVKCHSCWVGCHSNDTRLRHPSLPAPFSKYAAILEPRFLSLCFMPSYSFSATSCCLLRSAPALQIMACADSWMLCCQVSASTKTSLGRICHGLGLTLFSSEPSAGAARGCLLKSQPPIPFACGQDDGVP